MKNNRRIWLTVLLTFAMFTALVIPILSSAADTEKNAALPVNLRSTSTFAVLAGESITNTGATTISGDAGGDVGLYAGSSTTGFETLTMSGSLHVSDNIAIVAKTDLIYAYDDAASRIPAIQIPTQLGGITLTPGTYVSQSGNFDLTGTLTLNAQGDPNAVFVFQTSTTLITASSSNIVLINGAQSGLIYWQVGSSATLGSDSVFSGHILALTSITANTGAIIHGQLLARNGSVWLHGNTIINNSYEIILDTSSDISEASSDISEANSDVSEVSSEASDTSSEASDTSSVASDTSSDISEVTSDVYEVSSEDLYTSSTVSGTSSEPPVTGDSVNWLMSLLALVAISGTIAYILHKKSSKFRD